MKDYKECKGREKSQPSHHSKPAVLRSFSEYVLEALQKAGQVISDPAAPDALAELNYGIELEIKKAALSKFWKIAGLPDGMIREIIPSVRSRSYRTTSKRRCFFARGRFQFGMGYGHGGGQGDGANLEAELHTRIYRFLRKYLSCEKYLDAAKSLNYCVIRGSYEEAALIFNVFRANGNVVRNLRSLAQNVAAEIPELKSAFMLVDESRSDYYLENSAREGKDRMFKKFFGPGILVQKLDNKKLFYPPEVFSQVNGSMCGPFASAAVELLNPPEKARVIDLYCGYGLLTMKAAEKADSVFGMDWEGPAIRAAESNAEHLFPGKNIRFTAGAVTGESLQETLPPPGGQDEYILLDPPRSGAGNDVIEALASRHPKRVVAIFCGTDAIPASIRHWKANGYGVCSVRVLDMFPGTMNLETMVQLEQR